MGYSDVITIMNYGYSFYFYKYIYTEDSFLLFDSIIGPRATGIFDIGDFDNDSYPELLCGYCDYFDIDTIYLYTMEQYDTMGIWKGVTWTSRAINDTMFKRGIRGLAVTDHIRAGKDIIVTGWKPSDITHNLIFIESNGDNSFYISYEDSTKDGISKTVGYYDNDSLVDIIYNWEIYESYGLPNDSFYLAGSFTEGGGDEYNTIIDDIDNDGYNEVLNCSDVYAMLPCEWRFLMYECTGDNTYEKVWEDTIQKNYGGVDNVFAGSSFDTGDVDGDGEDELVLCAGSIMRIYDITGDNTFTKIYELDNDTFSGSHVKVYDYNRDGRAEILWGGESDPRLPLTYDILIAKTYLIEYTSIPDLELTLEEYDYGNCSLGTYTMDSLYVYNIGGADLIIDSMILKTGEFSIENEPAYPCTVGVKDSMQIRVEFSGISGGYYTDTLYIYSDDHYGEEDTVILKGGIEFCLEIDSIIASDNRIVFTGIDSDDYVRIYFNEPVDTTAGINAGTIDSILRLSGSHTWLSGSGTYGALSWTGKNRILTVLLSTNGGLPTVSVGDTVYPIIQDERQYSTTSNPILITGSFGPAGIEQPSAVGYQPSASLSINYEQSMLNITAPAQSSLIIYDITGRQTMNKSITQGNHTISISNIPSGIYFIKFNNINHKIFIIK